MGSIIPGAFGARYAQTIQDRLFVRAFVARSQGSGLAIASVDACGITADITQHVRKSVCSWIPIEPEQIMVVATHAHGGGPTLNWGEEVVRSEEYIRLLTDKAADSIVTAWHQAKESDLITGKEILEDVSFIRVYHMKDGGLKTNPGGELLTQGMIRLYQQCAENP